VENQQTTPNFNKILHQQCTIHCQSTCQILIISVKASNTYSNYCKVTPKKTSVSGLCGWHQTQKPEIKVFWDDMTTAAVTVVCVGRFN